MSKVIHFEIQADDLDRAKEFYEKAFGWKIEKAKGEVPMEYWMLMAGEKGEPGINGGMYQRPKDKNMAIKTFDCTILVKDIDQGIKAVKENGGRVEAMGGKEKMEIKGVGWFARCQDTEGNMFAIMQATDWNPM